MQPHADITVARVLSEGPGTGPLRLVCEASALLPHLDRAWLRQYLIERVDGLTAMALPGGGTALPSAETVVTLDADALSEHTVVFGATGKGKSRLLLHLAREQLRQDCSLIVLDPKAESIQQYLDAACELCLPAQCVSLVLPGRPDLPMPGWNPLHCPDDALSPAIRARNMTDLLHGIYMDSWGPQLSYLLRNALTLILAHGLSLFELNRFLTDETYRQGVLRLPLETADPSVIQSLHAFRSDFQARGRSDRTSAVSPVLNKIDEFVSNPSLQPLLCARRETFSLNTFWLRQQVLLVHLNDRVLGEEGARMLGALVLQSLKEAAYANEGSSQVRHPVVLVVDELNLLETFVDRILREVVRIGRSLGLRLVLAGQEFSQINDSLQYSLLHNAHTAIFFNAGKKEAAEVADGVSVGLPETVTRLTLDVSSRGGRGAFEPLLLSHRVQNTTRQPVCLPPEWWHYYLAQMGVDPAATDALVRRLESEGIGRLFVTPSDSGMPVPLRAYVAGIPRRDYWLQGPSPLSLILRAPKPRVIHVERVGAAAARAYWTRELQKLPRQEALITRKTGSTVKVRIVDVPLPNVDPAAREQYRAAVLVGGQAPEEIAAVWEWRMEQIVAVGGGAEGEVAPEQTSPSRGRTRARTTPLPEESDPSPPAPAAAMGKSARPPRRTGEAAPDASVR